MSNSIKKLLDRSGNFLRRMLGKPAWDFNRFVTDPRKPQGQRWPFKTLMRSLLFGFLTMRGSLRGVESLTETAFDQRVPDSTLYDFVGQFGKAEVAQLRDQLHAQTRTDWRSKSLEPVGLPCGAAAVDNKTLWTGAVAAAHDPDAQTVHPKNGPPYAQLRVVRSVLISAPSKPVIDQVVIRHDTNEGGTFPEVFAVLESNYGALIRLYSMDAGFCSKANADLVAGAGKVYLFGLKGNQPELFKEAQRQLGSLTTPEASTDWESYQGDRIRHHLYRTTEMAGYHGWSHLRQVWRIEKEIIKGQTGEVERENRYFVTNLPAEEFTPPQILSVVRSHWGIENNCNWTTDVIWDEDSKTWCGQGLGIQALSLLRAMAYNLISLLRCRYLRRRDQRRAAKESWKDWGDRLFLLITREGAKLLAPKPVTTGA